MKKIAIGIIVLLTAVLLINATPDDVAKKPAYKDVSEMPLPLLRSFLKEYWGIWETLKTDQRRGVEPPSVQKPCPENVKRIPLVPLEKISIGRMPLIEVMKQRRSRRRFTQDPLTLEELSFLTLVLS